MSRILVCDGEQRAALAAVRSLGRAGHTVFSCSHSPRALAAASRYTARFMTAPDPLSEPEAFTTAIRRLVKAWKPDVVLPVTEQSSAALLPARSGIAAIVPGPAAEAFRRIGDKRLVLEEAAAAGIATPHQTVAESRTHALSLELEASRFPLVMKPGRSVAGGRRFKVEYADSPEAARRVLAALPDEAYPVLLQQRITGPGCGVFLLVWDGRIIAAFAHRRIREQPPSGGASVCSESVAADPDLVSRSRALLDRFGWQGVAMVEYKLDQATGRFCLMEVNGRLWGSLQLAVDAGVDFPSLLVDAALGRPAPTPPRYRAGVRLRWLWGDVDHLIARFRHDAATLSLPPNAPGRFKVLVQTLAWRPGQRNETGRWHDPRPFLRDTGDFVLRHAAALAGLKSLARPLARSVRLWRDRLARPARRRASYARARRHGVADGLLFICYGNICRSPFAAAAARAVHSAGFAATGRASPAESVEAARALGVDLATHRSRLTDDLVTGRVLVLAMEPWQQRQAVELLGCAPENVLLLGDFDPDPSADSAIPDPLGGPASAHAACFERIERCVRSLIAALGWTEGGNRPAAGQAAAPAAGSLGR